MLVPYVWLLKKQSTIFSCTVQWLLTSGTRSPSPSICLGMGSTFNHYRPLWSLEIRVWFSQKETVMASLFFLNFVGYLEGKKLKMFPRKIGSVLSRSRFMVASWLSILQAFWGLPIESILLNWREVIS